MFCPPLIFSVVMQHSSQMAAHIRGKEYCSNVSSCLWEGALCGTKNGCEGDYGLKGVSCKLGRIEKKFVGMVVSSVLNSWLCLGKHLFSSLLVPVINLLKVQTIVVFGIC